MRMACDVGTDDVIPAAVAMVMLIGYRQRMRKAKARRISLYEGFSRV